jgi:DMSO reductase anchor subunit
VPFVLMLLGISTQSVALFCLASVTQYLGLVAERWFFFAEARHPQNIYYARAS